MRFPRTSASLSLAAAAICSPPGAVRAQSHVQFRPSLELAAGWDSNLFSTPGPTERDYVGRATPGLETAWFGPRHALRLRYEAEAEGFAEHRDLAAAPAGQAGEARLAFSGRTWAVETQASHTRTRRPEELSLATGIALGRTEARRTEARQVLAKRLSTLTEAELEYRYRREELSGASQAQRHVGGGGLTRRLSPVDEATLAYEVRHFVFDQGPAVTAHVIRLGWERRFTARTHLELEAGPRFTAGRVEPEGEMLLRHGFELGELSVAYSRTQTTIIGDRGVGVTDGFGAALTLRLSRRLALRVAPGFLLTRRSDSEARVLRTDTGLAWQATPYLALEGTHRFSNEMGGLGRTAGGSIRRNSFLLQVAIGVPAEPPIDHGGLSE